MFELARYLLLEILRQSAFGGLTGEWPLRDIDIAFMVHRHTFNCGAVRLTRLVRGEEAVTLSSVALPIRIPLLQSGWRDSDCVSS